MLIIECCSNTSTDGSRDQIENDFAFVWIRHRKVSFLRTRVYVVKNVLMVLESTYVGWLCEHMIKHMIRRNSNIVKKI